MTAHPVYGIGTAALPYIGDTVAIGGGDPAAPDLQEVGTVIRIANGWIAVDDGDDVFLYKPANLALVRRGEP